MVRLDGAKIARLRAAKGFLSQRALAEATRKADPQGIGISARVIWDAERGNPVSLRTQLLIAKALGVNARTLISTGLRPRGSVISVSATLAVALAVLMGIATLHFTRGVARVVLRPPPAHVQPLFDDMRGLSAISNGVTLTHDLLCGDLTILPGATLNTNGHNIFCSGTFRNEGEILTGYTGYQNFPSSYGGPGGSAGCGGTSRQEGYVTLGRNVAMPRLSADLLQRWYHDGMAHRLAGASGAGFTPGFGRIGALGANGLYIQAHRIEAGLIRAAGADACIGSDCSPPNSGGSGGGGVIVLAYGGGSLEPGHIDVSGGHGGSAACGAGANGGSGRVVSFAYGMAPAIDPVADAGLVTGTWRDPPIVITAARFTQRNGSYTVTVSGSGFGPSPFRHPFNGTAPYFKIGNVTERFEAGYTGDHIKLDYERWDNRHVVISGFQAGAGDCVGVNLWNPSTRLGAAWGGNVPPLPPTGPRIRYARVSANGEITIAGTGFGAAPAPLPFSSNANLVYFSNIAYHSWGEGPSVLFNIGDQWTNTRLLFEYWSNTRIEIAGFSGPAPQNGMFLEAGDPVSLEVWNPQRRLATAWGGNVR